MPGIGKQGQAIGEKTRNELREEVAEADGERQLEPPRLAVSFHIRSMLVRYSSGQYSFKSKSRSG